MVHREFNRRLTYAQGGLGYNAAVSDLPLEEMKRHIGWTQQDIVHLHDLADAVRPVIPWVVERFYDELMHQPAAREVFTGGEDQLRRLRCTLMQWLEELVSGRFDEPYYQKRFQIGITHVRVGLPQRFMPLAMELIRQELELWLRRANPPGLTEKLASLHKALTLELTVMMESYKEQYSEKIRIVERTVMEEKLTRAEHLAEIGQLAASLAHDIKNPLAGISGAIQVIREEMEENDPHRPILGEILGLISRLDATVKDLLLYARPNLPRPTLFLLREVATRVINLLREEPTFQRVSIVFDDHSPDIQLSADEGQIEQLLINLLINAAHASLDGDTIRLSLKRDEESAYLIVADQGAGMSPEIQARAFEPFFTTKAKGTGLGLSICRRIVDLHEGRISLESAVGRGTTVTVALPLMSDPLTEPRETAEFVSGHA